MSRLNRSCSSEDLAQSLAYGTPPVERASEAQSLRARGVILEMNTRYQASCLCVSNGDTRVLGVVPTYAEKTPLSPVVRQVWKL